MKERLNKIIAKSGFCSRRKADELISQGKVKVNQIIISELGTQADPNKDRILINNTPLKLEKKLYILLHKPKGYITTTKDVHAEKTVLDLLPDIFARVYPVGRLDKDSCGLLILTNDGNLSYKLTHPKFEIDRIYEVSMKNPLQPSTIKKIEKGGINIEDYKTSPCKIRIIRREKTKTKIRLILHEGRKREIRKIFALFDHPVIELKRIQFGKLKLGDLEPGKFRYLKKKEIL
ncbi:MAG: pseudouridine synthase [Candidatus Omnitrophota bacterium]